MTLPKKKSRTITVGEADYRWLVTVHDGLLNLTVESADANGQILIAYFDAYDLYVRDEKGEWRFKSQKMAIRPAHVRRIIEKSIEQGWQPSVRGLKPFKITEPEKLSDMPLPSPGDDESEGEFLKMAARQHLWSLMYDICMDINIRTRLENSDPQVRIPIPPGSASKLSLSFAAFKDSYNNNGNMVIGIECQTFPDLVEYYWWM